MRSLSASGAPSIPWRVEREHECLDAEVTLMMHLPAGRQAAPPGCMSRPSSHSPRTYPCPESQRLCAAIGITCK